MKPQVFQAIFKWFNFYSEELDQMNYKFRINILEMERWLVVIYT